MKLLTDPAAMSRLSGTWRSTGKRIGFVPTMGYLHEGHLTLVRKARELADRSVVSIFVNPTQFGPNEDLDRYPRNLERDRKLLEQEGVDVLFHPAAQAMYPDGFQTFIRVGELSQGLCGADRPGHFDGVCTVVGKLFHIVDPHCAVFGAKDYQQLAVIRQMTSDLNMEVEVVAHPIVREEDGLAMSSRNVNLRAEERSAALSLSRAIALAQEHFRNGEKKAEKLQQMVEEYILSHAGTAVDYVALVDPDGLQPVSQVRGDSMLLLAVKINNRVRLIDNAQIGAIG
jgi:pantoate--beta-alanine ligase